MHPKFSLLPGKNRLTALLFPGVLAALGGLRAPAQTPPLPATAGPTLSIGEPIVPSQDPAEAPSLLPPPEETVPGSSPAQPAATGPSVSVTVNLIRQLIELGVLPKEKARQLLVQAEEEAAQVRAQILIDREASVRAAVAEVLQSAPTSQGFEGVEPLPPPDSSSRVTYVPEVVRAQIRDEIRRDLQTTAQLEHWGGQEKLPDWVRRFTLFSDFRLRGEGIFFGTENNDEGAFPNFNAINTGLPYDTSSTILYPTLNTSADRQRLRLRARLGLESQLGEGFTAGVRLSTGNTNNPVSTNQDLGLANNLQGGNFSRYSFWLERAFVQYEMGAKDATAAKLILGRFENPFFSTEAIWDEDLGFDGFALQASHKAGRFTPFFTAGAFPVFNTSLNFASNQPKKFSSSDKWLYAAQAGTQVALSKADLKLAAALYEFDNIEGRLSDPFVPLTAEDAGNTDGSRPSFAQKGNTYRELRNIIPTAANNFGTSKQFQYYGLATPFRPLALTSKLDLHHWEPFTLSLSAEYLKNLAFDRDLLQQYGINNRRIPEQDPNNPSKNTGDPSKDPFIGSDAAWMVGLRVGKPVFLKRGDWALSLNYRYIGSDATVDGFNDSNLGLGGTNLKGFAAWGGVALSERTNLSLRWASSDEVDGERFSVDIFQIDFNAKF